MESFTNIIISFIVLLFLTGMTIFKWDSIVDLWINGEILGYIFIFAFGLLGILSLITLAINIMSEL